MTRRFAARYEPVEGKIHWRGSDDRWVYMPRSQAVKVAAELHAVITDTGIPGWAATAQRFASDLDEAIAQFEADQHADA